MLSRFHLFFCAVVFSWAVRPSAAASDADVYIESRGSGEKSDFVWTIKRSRLEALPAWDPFSQEAPLSPYKAVAAAAEFVKLRLGLERPEIWDVSLFRLPGRDNLWAYHVYFMADSVKEEDKPLLNVVVPPDGNVIVPVKRVIAQLTDQLRWVEHADPKRDLQRNITKGDTRFLVCDGVSGNKPPVTMWDERVAKHETRVLEGTGEPHNDEQARLIGKAIKYATQYNDLLLAYLKSHE